MANADGETAASRIKEIRNDYGVDVRDKFDPHFFHESWRRPPISARASQISASEVDRILPVVTEFLGQHPKQVIQATLKRIILIGSLEFYGNVAGGTNTDEEVFIVSRADGDFTRVYLLGMLNHEFSSILFHRYSFPTDEWQSCNPIGFEYDASNLQSPSAPGMRRQDRSVLNDGFLYEYARSSMENDFNEISDWLFVRPGQLKRACEQSARLKAKVDLAKKFYKSIDSDYFSSTATSR